MQKKHPPAARPGDAMIHLKLASVICESTRLTMMLIYKILTFNKRKTSKP